MGGGPEENTGDLSLFSPVRGDLEAPHPPSLESQNSIATWGRTVPKPAPRAGSHNMLVPEVWYALGWPLGPVEVTADVRGVLVWQVVSGVVRGGRHP